MPFYHFRSALQSFLQVDGLPFADVLSEETIDKVFADENVNFGQAEGSIYTPALTLWAFLSQAVTVHGLF